MGMQQQEFVVVLAYDYKDQLQDLVEQSEGMIVIIPALTNMYTNIFFGHHGSKCTSDISEKFNKLRKEFLDRVKELGYDWYTMGWSEFGDGETSHGSFANENKVAWVSPDY